MKFEWDNKKNKSNIKKHGIDFNDAEQIFENPLLIKEDNRFDYGEKRWIGIGRLLEFVVVVIFTFRNKVIRIISLRLANKNEKEGYYETFK
ncbi:MAG: BrnT family toxin [Bacteroidetes bacterium]|nr:MAG: BrnT family toxin [Bacteroidota bacterium]